MDSTNQQSKTKSVNLANIHVLPVLIQHNVCLAIPPKEDYRQLMLVISVVVLLGSMTMAAVNNAKIVIKSVLHALVLVRVIVLCAQAQDIN